MAVVSVQAGRGKSREDASFEVHLRSNGDNGKLQSSLSSQVHKNVERGRHPRETKTSFHSVHVC